MTQTTLSDFLRLIATRLEQLSESGDRVEALRLCRLMIETINNAIQKLEKQDG